MEMSRSTECVVCHRQFGGESVTPTIVPVCPVCKATDCPDCGCVNFAYRLSREQYECDNGCGPFTLEEALAMYHGDSTMNEPTVHVVVEQTDTTSDRIRRVFTDAESAQAYVDDPENVGTFYTEEHHLNAEWEGYDAN